ncbi:MAG: AAA family ATPase, partial [Pseudomonadota bacterium]
MLTPTLANKTIRVQSIRSQSDKTFGGAIFSGYVVNTDGQIKDAKESIVVKAPYSILCGISVERGQWWEVYGETETYHKEINGFRIKEVQILPHEMQLVRPSGEHIVRLIADSKEFQFIGEVKARQLWEKFGEELYGILDNKDITKLREVVSLKTAYGVIYGWQKYTDTKTILWLVKNGFNAQFSKKLLNFYGKNTANKIEEDPYRLLAFMGNWKKVDALALNKFKLEKNNPRRLKGAIEEALYIELSKGNTAATLTTVQNHLKKLLKTDNQNWSGIISETMVKAYAAGCYAINILNGKLVLHVLGSYIMEKTIAANVNSRIDSQNTIIDTKKIEVLLNEFESGLSYKLNKEQKLAVYKSTSSDISVITGGAGTGKTTVLEAVYHIYDEIGVDIHQMALSGRAAKRMQEATGREATTIAGFLKNVKTETFNQNTVIVIDEASMLDVATMYRIFRNIPAETKILLAGDSAQLPPIGAGMVLHDILKSEIVPVTELTIINRYGGNIAFVANSIREGKLPELNDNIDDEICFIPCKVNEIKEKLVSLYDDFHKNNSDVQILEPVKAGKYCGTQHTNQLCHDQFSKDKEQIKVWNNEFDQYESLQFKVDEPVICIKNHWDKELQNGSLGIIKKAYKKPVEQFNSKDEYIGLSYAEILWDDGILRPLMEGLIDDVVLAYSITIHKAQGSQWDFIVLPIYQARNLDRSMLYTAITRAQKKVIMLGDIEE